MARLILAQVLKRKGISKLEFGRRLGIKNPENVYRLFRPGVDPHFSALKRYARALRCKVRDLIKE